MSKSIRHYAFIAAMACAAGYAAIPQAFAQSDDVGTHIYSPTPQLFKPFEMQMKMTPKEMTVIRADIKKMHKITCTLNGTGSGSDMAVLHCTPGG